jgi:Sugar phosphate isomerases/epimerases
MFKFGFQSAILPDYTFEQVMDFAGENGFECVEVCCWPKGKAARRYAGITHIDISELDDAKMKYYLDYAASKGVMISSLGYYPNPLSSDAEAAEAAITHIKDLIVASGKMGIGMITTFIGRDKDKTVEENLDLYEKVWTPIVKLAEENNVKIGIENCPMLFTADEWPGGNNLASAPYIWREMFKRIPSDNLGLNYDPAHPYLIGADYIKPIYEFKDKIFHIHFKDLTIKKEKLDEYGRLAYPRLWISEKLPGLGDIDFAKMCSALYDIRFEGCACIEVEDRAFESCDEDIKRSIVQSARYLRNFI